jgi:hypothetical protein
MLRALRFPCLILLALVLVLFTGGSASAASTRAEYVAQVDPICQAQAGPMAQAFGAFNKNYKRWVHVATHGSLKAWLKQTKRLGRSLNGINVAHSSLTDQIAAVAPPPEDVAPVNTWLGYRRQAEANGQAAVTALNRLAIDKFYKALDRADAADLAAARSAAGLGFHVCGVIV